METKIKTEISLLADKYKSVFAEYVKTLDMNDRINDDYLTLLLMFNKILLK